MTVTLLQGSALNRLQDIEDNSIQCCVTSPPYYGLRDYGTARWEGGDPGCDHDVRRRDGPKQTQGAQSGHAAKADKLDRDVCGNCGARRIDDQIGLEETPEAYVARLVEIFREVRRVLHPTGTLFLNIGDSYAGGGRGGDSGKSSLHGSQSSQDANKVTTSYLGDGLKPKDLIGIPWMVAFALRADGWYLRSEIIWWKPNPMPESVRDRPTKSHEQLFLLSKSPHYFYDQEAIKETASYAGNGRGEKSSGEYAEGTGTRNDAGRHKSGGFPTALSRNKRDVWEIPEDEYLQFLNWKAEQESDPDVWRITTKPFPGAHFATFPPELPETCILAGTSERGQCPKCGNPWERVVEKGEVQEHPARANRSADALQFNKDANQYLEGGNWPHSAQVSTLGWRPSCACGLDPVPQIVLDPFNGAGTTGLVSVRNGREYVGIDLNQEYLEMTRKRLEKVQIGMPV